MTINHLDGEFVRVSIKEVDPLDINTWTVYIEATDVFRRYWSEVLQHCAYATIHEYVRNVFRRDGLWYVPPKLSELEDNAYVYYADPFLLSFPLHAEQCMYETIIRSEQVEMESVAWVPPETFRRTYTRGKFL